MLTKQYRKKPVVIEAVEVPRYERNKVVEYLELCVNIANWCKGISYMMESADPLNHILIPTLEGDMKALPGDFIIKGVNGEFYPCKADIFRKTYEEVKVAPPLNVGIKKLQASVSPPDHEESPQG